MAAQPSAVAAPSPAPRNFGDIVALIDQRRDIALRLDVEKYVRLISFRPGAISFEPAPGAPNNLAQRLSARLKEWTGQPWLVAAEGGGGAETLAETKARELEVARTETLADPFVRQVMDVFPGAELTDIRTLAPPEPAAAATTEDEDDEDEDA
jgi:DNA polymerase-3 subunit gamma/tau